MMMRNRPGYMSISPYAAKDARTLRFVQNVNGPILNKPVLTSELVRQELSVIQDGPTKWAGSGAGVGWANTGRSGRRTTPRLKSTIKRMLAAMPATSTIWTYFDKFFDLFSKNSK